MSTLKRWLSQQDLVRYLFAGMSPLRDIVNVKAKELGCSSSNIVYPKMHVYLPGNGMICRREDIRATVKELDPKDV